MITTYTVNPSVLEQIEAAVSEASAPGEAQRQPLALATEARAKEMMAQIESGTYAGNADIDEDYVDLAADLALEIISECSEYAQYFRSKKL